MKTGLHANLRRRTCLGAPGLLSILIAGALGISASAAATDLRGRIESRNQFTSIATPRSGAAVELLDASGRRVLGRYSTGPDGMYYFRNIAPGSYKLRVAGSVYPLSVESRPAQDIAPIRLQR